MFSKPGAVVTPVADVGVTFKVIDALRGGTTPVTVADVAGATAKTSASVGDLLLFAGSMDSSNSQCKLYYFTHYLSTNTSNSNKH